VAMTGRDRKRLWGQAAATCSMCRKELVELADHDDDREALVGDEAHIISELSSGPRGDAAYADIDFDSYDNRILLCTIDHRIVDEQVHEYSVQKLHELKSKHEQWVRRCLRTLPDDDPPGLRPKFTGRGMVLPRLRTGRDAWDAAIGSSFYLLDSIGEDEASTEACDIADGFLTNLRDCVEIHDAITDRGFAAIRDAQRELRKDLDELGNLGLAAFGAQREMLITGLGRNPAPATMAVVVVRPQTEVNDKDTLPIIFSAHGSSG